MSRKEYAFAVLVMILAAVAMVFVLWGGGEKETYAPQVYEAPEETEKPAEQTNEVIEIRRTKLVYYYADSETFHIKPGCSGIDETLEGHPCGTALELGKKPCGRCMKNYRILD